ncbi:restriction endonuclease subunit S [Pseudodonghicola xiamenensis]|uniref:restriction endonuclease subunit S n=1 Tax=Pseudodonghicola xiamenensis TaxID=337702 RepID=UPI0013769090|nr:restriction endonuclease subunit S [Pseudodonghicola xiamenensis]
MPELRFPEFKGPWKPARAGDAFRNSKAKGEAGLPIYSVTQDRGLVRRNSLERHMGADAADETNLRAQPGDLVYNMMRMWQGAVGMASEECMVSPAYVVLSPKKGVSSKFFDYWFQNRHMLHQLWAYSHGMTSDRLRLYYQDFAKIPLALPDQPEQEKIAVLLDASSRKITLLTDKKAALEDYKRGLMQRLFSRELRFTRDDGSAFPDWEERKLGEIATFFKGKGISKSDIVEGGALPCIRYGEIYTHYRERITEVISFTDDDPASLFLSEIGDVIIPASGEDRMDMARACCVAIAGVALGGDINVLRSPVNGSFLAYYLNNARRREIANLGQGISVVHLYPSQLKTLWVELPHPDEQQKISSALSAVDGKIDALSQKISEMEAFKKGLLQKLFV